MLEFFNKVSNYESTNKGSSIMNNGDTTTLSATVFKCSSDDECGSRDSMIITDNLSGSIECSSDNDICVIDGESSRRIMYLYGTGGLTFTLRSLTFKDGSNQATGGICVVNDGIIDVILCLFTNCLSVDDEGAENAFGALYTFSSRTTVNLYATRFEDSSAPSAIRNDIRSITGTVTVHEKCPSPYAANTPARGSALRSQGTVNGSPYSYGDCNIWPASDMGGLFEKISNYVTTNTGEAIIANGDIVLLSTGTYKCSGSAGTCVNAWNMLYTNNLFGSLKCVDEAEAACVVDGEDERRGIRIVGTGGAALKIRACTFTKGLADESNGGAIEVREDAIVDLILVKFSSCQATGTGGGAIYVEQATVNIFGSTFTTNNANLGDGDDIFRFSGTVTVENTCPSPYAAKSPQQGSPLQVSASGISGPPFSYSDCFFYSCEGGYNPTFGGTSSFCSSCAPGRYNPSSGSTTDSACLSCGTGEYSGLFALFCSGCAEGKYLTDAGTATESSACTPCASSTFSAASSTSCASCDVGQYSGPSSSSCTECAQGKYLSNAATSDEASACTPCAASTFSTFPFNTCIPCSVGQYSGMSSHFCSTCVPGKYLVSATTSVETTACQTCEEGKNSPPGALSCPSWCPASVSCIGKAEKGEPSDELSMPVSIIPTLLSVLRFAHCR